MRDLAQSSLIGWLECNLCSLSIWMAGSGFQRQKPWAWIDKPLHRCASRFQQALKDNIRSLKTQHCVYFIFRFSWRLPGLSPKSSPYTTHNFHVNTLLAHKFWLKQKFVNCAWMSFRIRPTILLLPLRCSLWFALIFPFVLPFVILERWREDRSGAWVKSLGKQSPLPPKPNYIPCVVIIALFAL